MMLGAMTSDVRGRARLSSSPVGGSIAHSRRNSTLRPAGAFRPVTRSNPGQEVTHWARHPPRRCSGVGAF
jgi:hypothetical protein